MGFFLTSINHEIFHEPPPPPQCCFKFKQLKIGDTLRVRHLRGYYNTDVSPNLAGFLVANDDEMNHGRAEVINLAHMGDWLEIPDIDQLQINDPVAIEIYEDVDGCFQRALVRDVLGPEKVRVLLVDWGDTIDVDLGRLRPLNEIFLNYPAIALYCATETEVERSELYRMHDFIITVEDVGNNFDVPHKVSVSEMRQ